MIGGEVPWPTAKLCHPPSCWTVRKSTPATRSREAKVITDPDAGPFERAVLRPRPARPSRTSAEASGAAVSSGVAIMDHGGSPGGRENHPPSLASPVRPETLDEGRGAGQMDGWDLDGGRQMLQTIRQESPRCAAPGNFSDTSLLGAGKHGGVIVVDPHHVGQWPGLNSRSASPTRAALTVGRLLHLEPRVPALEHPEGRAARPAASHSRFARKKSPSRAPHSPARTPAVTSTR
jgi:hypothetical protein